MTNRIPKLTKRSVDAIGANGGDAVYWDGELTGFGLRVRASGRKKYVVQTRIRGRLRWFTIGPHGPVSVDEARARALEILALAKKGVDPRAGEAQPAAAPAVAALGRRFLEEYVPIYCKPSTAAQYRRLVNRFVDPAIGDLTVGEVQRKDIAELHYAMRDTPYQANRTLGMLSKMFTLAEVWNWRPDGTNPCRHVRNYKEHKRERFLSERETARLGAVLRDLEEEMPSAVAAFRLLLLHRVPDVRNPGPALGACQGRLHRAARFQDRRAHRPRSAPRPRRILASIPREKGNPWVFVGRFPGTHRTDLQRPWRLIRKRAGLETCASTTCATPSPPAPWRSARA